MKNFKKCLVFATSLLLLVACDGKESKTSNSSSSSSSSTKATLTDLKNAIDTIGNNFTLNFVDFEQATGKTVVSEKYYGAFLVSGQISGYMKLEDDKNTIHYYEYVPKYATEDWDAFYDLGRVDYLDEEFASVKELNKVLNLNTFSKTLRDTTGLTFHSDDLQSILRLLDLTSHPLAYYFGHAHDGIDIILNTDLTLKQINFLGFNEEMLGSSFVAPEDNIFYSITVDDIGTSAIDYLEAYTGGQKELQTPAVYMLLRIDRNGTPLYDGERFGMTGLLTAILDMGDAATMLCDGSPAYFPDASTLNPWENYAKEITVEATVSSLDGAVVFTDAELVSVGDEEDLFFYQLNDIGTWEDEFVDSQNGPMMNGLSVKTSLTYVSGTVSTSEASTLNFKFNNSTPVKVKFSEGLDEEKKQEFIDFFEGEGVESGTAIDFTNLTFRWENGPVLYVGETTWFNLAVTFESMCMDVLGTSVPEPASLDGWNIMFEDRFQIDDENQAVGVLAVGFIQESGFDTFANDYAAILVEAGYTLQNKFTDSDGDMWYVYQKDNIVVCFTAYKLNYDDGTYECRCLIEAFDLENTEPIPMDEE